MEEIVEQLIETEHTIYDFYKMIQKRIAQQEFNIRQLKTLKKDEKTEIRNKMEQQKGELEQLWICLNKCIQREEKLLENLRINYGSRLSEIYVRCMDDYTIEKETILENYITLSDKMIPLLRFTLRIISIIPNNIVDAKIKEEEDGELLYEDDEALKKKQSQFELIINTIFYKLELETCVRFMNVAQVYEEITDLENELREKLKQVPYDMAYLNPILEKLFLEDKCINPSYYLFDTKITFEEEFEPRPLAKAIEDHIAEQLKQQLTNLASKTQTRTSRIALLRTIYIDALLGLVSDDMYNSVLLENREELENISYEYGVIPVLKKASSKIEIIEVSDETIDIINADLDKQAQKKKI